MIFRHLLNMRSHPTWVRGLKHPNISSYVYKPMSHPTWVRGLKQICYVMAYGCNRRTLRGCVD